MKKVFSYTIFYLSILAILVYFVDSTNIIKHLAEENKKLKLMLEISVGGYNDVVEENQDLLGYAIELEEYIEYIYCPLEFGNAQALIKYDLHTQYHATEIMKFKLLNEDGVLEDLKAPPMEFDCRWGI